MMRFYLIKLIKKFLKNSTGFAGGIKYLTCEIYHILFFCQVKKEVKIGCYRQLHKKKD